MLTERQLLSRILIPHIAGLTSFVILCFCGWFFRESLRLSFFGPTLIPGLFQVAAVLLFAAFGALIVLFLALDFAARGMLLHELKRRGYTPSGSISWSRSTFREVSEALLRLCLLVVIGVVFVISLLLPGINLLTSVLFAFYLGVDVVATNLSYLNMPLSPRMSIIRLHLWEVFWLGAVLAFALSIPFLGIIVLPLATLIAGEMVSEWVDEHPQLLSPYVTR